MHCSLSPGALYTLILSSSAVVPSSPSRWDGSTVSTNAHAGLMLELALTFLGERPRRLRPELDIDLDGRVVQRDLLADLRHVRREHRVVVLVRLVGKERPAFTPLTITNAAQSALATPPCSTVVVA